MIPQAAIAFGALGDFLLTLPLLRELTHSGSVNVIARGAYRALLPDWLDDSRFLAVDGPACARLLVPGARFGSPLAEAVEGAVVQVFARQDERLGEILLRNGARDVVFHDPRPTRSPHIVERFFLRASVAPPSGWLDRPTMPVTTAGDAFWVHAGSGSSAKNLPPALLAEKAAEWQGRTGAAVVVSFGEADLLLRESVAQAFASAGVVHEEVVCPSLGELRLGLSRRAASYLGADTGVSHLAAALGKEAEVGFRSTDPAVWRPVGKCRVLSLAEAGA